MKVFYLLSLILLPFFLTSSPREIHSFEEIRETLLSLEEEDLVVFDVDHVLFTTKDHFTHPYAEESMMQILLEEMLSLETEEEKKEWERSLSLALLLSEKTLIEPQTPWLIESLQQKGVKVIALTHSPTGPFGAIASMEEWKVNVLQSLGFHLEKSFPSFSFFFLPSKESVQNRAFYREGVLFSGGQNKETVLSSFLSLLSLYPSSIHFIDDLKENVEGVERFFRETGLKGNVYHYKGAGRFFRKEADLNLLQKQMEALKETGCWLSDAEVESLLRMGF